MSNIRTEYKSNKYYVGAIFASSSSDDVVHILGRSLRYGYYWVKFDNTKETKEIHMSNLSKGKFMSKASKAKKREESAILDSEGKITKDYRTWSSMKFNGKLSDTWKDYSVYIAWRKEKISKIKKYRKQLKEEMQEAIKKGNWFVVETLKEKLSVIEDVWVLQTVSPIGLHNPYESVLIPLNIRGRLTYLKKLKSFRRVLDEENIYKYTYMSEGIDILNSKDIKNPKAFKRIQLHKFDEEIESNRVDLKRDILILKYIFTDEYEIDAISRLLKLR